MTQWYEVHSASTGDSGTFVLPTPQGCLVRVSSAFSNGCQESLAFVPGATLEDFGLKSEPK